MTKGYLGIDTSNYASSAAYLDGDTLLSEKELITLEKGIGLRQSDCVFLHSKNLNKVIERLFENYDCKIFGIGFSKTPRDIEGSYMPAFVVGTNVALSLAAVLKVPAHFFSHQAGHVAAAIYGSDATNLLDKEFLAVHLSGGTTDLLKVSPCKDRIFKIEQIGGSLDLMAGQAVDRVAAMLGLPFPGGAMLSELAKKSDRSFKIKPYIKGYNISLSGVENKCTEMKKNGEPDCDIAKYCIDYICFAIKSMLTATRKDYNLPVLGAGGVLSNETIKAMFITDFDGHVAPPKFSGDSAIGPAFLCKLKEEYYG